MDESTVKACGARAGEPCYCYPMGQGSTLCHCHSPMVRCTSVPIAKPAVPDDLFSAPGYEKLAKVLAAAYIQASAGKGHERHASGEPFHEQPICAINRLHGSIDGALFQAAKKAHEARRLPRERAVAELLGALNYIAACVILVEEGILDKPGEFA